MPDPKTREDYDRRFFRNQEFKGYGIEEVTTHMPCPFCAAADWRVFKVIDAHGALHGDATCSDCKRTARGIVTRSPDGGMITFKMVQVSGDDPPSYLPPMERVEA